MRFGLSEYVKIDLFVGGRLPYITIRDIRNYTQSIMNLSL